MNYRNKLLVFFFLITALTYSQIKIKGLILDSETKSPIPYVTVIKYQDEISVSGLYSDQNGIFEVTKLNDNEKIELSHIGYETKKISIEERLDTIYLVNSITLLNEVIVSNIKNIEQLGFLKSKKKTLLSSSKGMEICQFIENPYNKTVNLKSLLFKIKRYKDYKTAIRIHLYKKVLQKKEPGEEILTENIIYIIEGKEKKLLEIDLHGLELPIEGAFIGIEWLGNVDEKTGKFVDDNKISDTFIEMNDNINEFNTFKRNRLMNKDWINTALFKKSVEKQIKFKNVPNASFGIKVYTE